MNGVPISLSLATTGPNSHLFLMTSKSFILIQTPLQLDIWLQSYEGFVNAKNNTKQKNLNTVFANISKTTSPTSDSFLLIMSQMSRKYFLKLFMVKMDSQFNQTTYDVFLTT